VRDEESFVRRWFPAVLLASALSAPAAGASLISASYVGDALCGYTATICVVQTHEITPASGLAGDTFELLLLFSGGQALALADQVTPGVHAGIGKPGGSWVVVDYVATMALTDGAGAPITPFVDLYADSCVALFGCGFGNMPSVVTPEFANVTARGVLVRFETSSAEAIPIHAAIPSWFLAFTFDSPGAAIVPEPASLALLAMGTAVLGARRSWRRTSAPTGAPALPGRRP
jgi:hypothetical protein